MADAKQVILDNGKYRFFMDPDGALYCERYGYPWREFVGDHAVSLLFEAAVAPAGGGSGSVAPPGDAPPQVAARQVAEWLFDYESLLNSLANQFKVTRDEDLEGTGRRLEERATEVSEVAARLYDQKGVVRDSGYQDLLLQECARRLSNSPNQQTVYFSTTAELLEAIRRHTR